jgi:hypothetical protein
LCWCFLVLPNRLLRPLQPTLAHQFPRSRWTSASTPLIPEDAHKKLTRHFDSYRWLFLNTFVSIGVFFLCNDFHFSMSMSIAFVLVFSGSGESNCSRRSRSVRLRRCCRSRRSSMSLEYCNLEAGSAGPSCHMMSCTLHIGGLDTITFFRCHAPIPLFPQLGGIIFTIYHHTHQNYVGPVVKWGEFISTLK